MKIIPFKKPTNTEIGEAVKVLKNGGMIIFPTETCYGIGVDATNETAVKKLLAYKGGRENKAISVAMADRMMAEEYVEINEMAENLYTTLLPGPVTVVSKGKHGVAKGLESETGTLGIRIPAYPPILKLIKFFGKPITATSANTSGMKPPYSLTDWQKYTSIKKQQMVNLFLDASTLPHHPPSTLIDTTLNELTILRQGEITIPQAHNLFVSSSDQETQILGEEIMSSLVELLAFRPIIIALQGELGAGKTQMAKGVARALGIREMVNSPTYTIVREYPYKLLYPGSYLTGIIYHMDTWRLHEGSELWDLGFEDMLKPGNVIVIEWLQKMKEELKMLAKKATIVWVDIEQVSECERKIRWWREDGRVEKEKEIGIE